MVNQAIKRQSFRQSSSLAIWSHAWNKRHIAPGQPDPWSHREHFRWGWICAESQKIRLLHLSLVWALPGSRCCPCIHKVEWRDSSGTKKAWCKQSKSCQPRLRPWKRRTWQCGARHSPPFRRQWGTFRHSLSSCTSQRKEALQGKALSEMVRDLCTNYSPQRLAGHWLCPCTSHCVSHSIRAVRIEWGTSRSMSTRTVRMEE